jgi:cation diffusion facilitator CzcD-associated flavoprotein CzcO
LVDGATILKYINEAADEYKVRDHIVTKQKAVTFNFDSQVRTIVAANPATNEETIYTCQFIFSCVGIIIT